MSYEVHSDCRDVILVEGVILIKKEPYWEANKQTRFAHTRVTNEHYFKQEIAVLRIHTY